MKNKNKKNKLRMRVLGEKSRRADGQRYVTLVRWLRGGGTVLIEANDQQDRFRLYKAKAWLAGMTCEKGWVIERIAGIVGKRYRKYFAEIVFTRNGDWWMRVDWERVYTSRRDW